MACIITYKNNKYSQQEFEKYFKNNFNEFINEFLSQDIEGFKDFVSNNNEDDGLAFMKSSGLSAFEKPIETRLKILRAEKSRLLNEGVNRVLSEEQESNNLKKVAELQEEINRLNTNKKNVLKNTKVEEVLVQWGVAHNRLLEILNKDKITTSELKEMKELVELWKVMTDYTDPSGNHILWDVEEITYTLDSNGKPDNPLIEVLNKTIEELKLIEVKVNKLYLEGLRQITQKNLGRPITIEDITNAVGDLGMSGANTLNLGQTNHPVIQALWKSINRVNNRAKINVSDKFKELDETFEKAKKSSGLSTKELFNLFKEKWESGKPTSDMVDEYTPEYMYYYRYNIDELRNIIKELEAKELPAERKAELNKRFDKFMDWRNRNTVTLNVNALFPDAQINSLETIPDNFISSKKEDREVELARLRLYIKDEDKLQKILEKQRKKVERFKRKRLLKYEQLTTEFEDAKTIENIFNLWLDQNSPYRLNIGSGKNKPNFYHTISIPASVAYYSKQYQQIENNKDVKALHDMFKSIIYEAGNITGASKYHGGWMSQNSLPHMKASLLDNLMSGKTAGLRSNIFNEITDFFAESDLGLETGEVNILTGRIEKERSTRIFQDKASKINQRLKERVASFVSNNNRVPTDKELFEIKQDITSEFAGTQDFDILKLMKLMYAEGEISKQRQVIDDEVKAVESFFYDNYKAAETNRAGINTGRRVKTATNLNELLEFTLDNEFYGIKTKKTEGIVTNEKIKNFLRTPEEKKRAEDIKNQIALAEKEYEKLKNTPDVDEVELLTKRNEVESLKDKLKLLGKNITFSQTLDSALKYNQIKGMGWNLFSAVANLNMGTVANIIESADGREFNGKDLHKAYKMLMGSIMKNTFFDKFAPGEALKIRAIMDRFDILSEQSRELYKTNSDGSYMKNMRRFSPYNVVKRVEFLNQAAVVVAKMLHKESLDASGNKVSMYDAYDKTGKLKEGYSLGEKRGELAEDLEADFITSVKQSIDRIHGDYNHTQMGKKYVLGRMGFQYRSWIPEGIATRFISQRPDEIFGYDRKGRWRSYKGGHLIPVLGQIQLIKDYALALKNEYSKSGNEADKIMDSANLRKNMVELVFILITMTVGMLLKMAFKGEDDDDEENLKVVNFLVNQTTRLNTELLFFINPNEFQRLNQNILPILKLADDATKVVDSYKRLFDDRPMDVQNGPYEGMNWMLRSHLEFFPITSSGMSLYRRTYDILE